MSTLGLALGGGGARGLAHIGVLKVLEENDIEIGAISGCSMGAVIGALYAYYRDAHKLEELITETIKNTDFDELGFNLLAKDYEEEDSFLENLTDYVKARYYFFRTLNRLSFFDEHVADKLFSFIPDVAIENLQLKFSAISTDLVSGEEINFEKGSLREIVKASSAIPGVFPPVEIGEYVLVDGAASQSVPVDRVREIGADRVLAIDVMRCLQRENPPEHFIDLLLRTEDITSFHLSKLRLENADLIIRPDVRDLDWSQFRKAGKIITEGELAAQKNLSAIKKLANKNSYLLEIEQYIKKLTS